MAGKSGDLKPFVSLSVSVVVKQLTKDQQHSEKYP